MRPILLEMTAFGPYKNKTVIDFSSIGAGIYAITGPTGAGKTTIFDALMFALFEEVSGQDSVTAEKGTIRNKSMVRCKYADDKTDTVVKLVFEERGTEYTVRRTIHKTRTRESMTAELEGGGIAESGSRKVTEQVEMILGNMDASRFRRIVMLAQGQFRAFMEAKDEQRKEILTGIFDTAKYRVFSERLKNASKKLEDMKADQEQALRNRLSPDIFILPEESGDEERARYSPDLPSYMLRENLISLINADHEAEKKLEAEENSLKEALGELNRILGAAEKANQEYDELERSKRHLAELNEREDEIKSEEESLKWAERALHSVRPEEDAHVKAAEAEHDASVSLNETKKKLEEAAEIRKTAEEAAGKNPERKKEAERLASEIQRMTDHLADFDRLAEAELELKKEEDAYKKAVSERGDAAKKLENAARRLELIDTELAELKNAEVEAEKAQRALEDAEKAEAVLTDKKTGFRSRVRALINEEGALIDRINDAKKAADESARASEHYADVYRRYISGYAGKLGLKLKNEVDEKGRGRCPVCGSEFSSDDVKEFTLPGDSSASDDELKAAEDARNAADERHRNADSSLVSAATSLEANRAQLMAALEKELPDFAPWEWDGNMTSVRLEVIIADHAKQKDEKKLALKRAIKNADSKTALEKEKSVLMTMREKAEKDKSDAEKAAVLSSGRTDHFRELCVQLKAALEAAGMGAFSVKKDAELAVKKLTSDRSAVEKAVIDADSALAKASSAVSNLEGVVEEMKNSLDRASKEKLSTRERFENALKEAGFSDESSYREIAAGIRGDGEAYLNNKRAGINAYKNDLANTAARVSELTERSPVYTDTDAIRAELKRIDGELKATGSRRSSKRREAESHEKAFETLEHVSERLAVLERASRRMKDLSDAANGENSTGGKRTFDGYVLGNTFREVLDHASYYLDEMTGGRYVLHHDVEAAGARSNAFANFRINVNDVLGGTFREIGTLSGGESFQAAMALALGLSDTVQSHVSAVSVDTMFIDEGFGTLDKDSLKRMLSVLTDLSDGKRQIGIISHVDDLKEDIGKFIRVKSGREREGSTLTVEV